MHTEGVAHGPATLFLHCGSTNFVRPSMGSWVLYGLGTENENLPGFASIAPSAGNGGARNYGNAFLPAVYQGTALGKAGAPASRRPSEHDRSVPVPGREPPPVRASPGVETRSNLREHPGDSELEAIVSSYELAWRMQSHAPDVFDLNASPRRRGRSTASANRRPTTSAGSA
jgi:hypothetical protein